MAKSKFETGMDYVRKIINSFQEQGKDVHYSATFISGREKAKLIDRAPVKLLPLIGKNLKGEETERIRIEVYDGKDAPNPMWTYPIDLKNTEKQPAGFQGLGEVEINRIVDERFKERVKDAEYEDLKHLVGELTQENLELQNSLDEMEDKAEKLEQELESKKQIRYYAGMLGDIFESFGISKDRIKKPIAELMGITDGEEKEHRQIEGKKEDSSGIVEEKGSVATPGQVSTEEQKRTEIISLICEYLKSTSNQTLANVFSIFSEIEADNAIADKVIQYINTLKTE